MTARRRTRSTSDKRKKLATTGVSRSKKANPRLRQPPSHTRTGAKSRPRAVDLFCGAGGMSLGFEQAGFDIVVGVDRDAHHCAAHDRNFPYGKTLCTSVADLTGKKIREACGLNGDLDLVIGGPPCQGFSMMGKRSVEDPRNSLIGHYVRLVRELRPKAFVMENVPGMQLGATKAYFDFVIEELSQTGYNIRLPVQTLIASELGAPQKRERLFVLGLRNDIGDPPHYPVEPLLQQAVARSVGDALQGLPKVDAYDELFSQDEMNFSPADSPGMARYSRIMAGLESDPTDLSFPRVSVGNLLYGNRRSRHSQASIDLYQATTPGQMVPGHKLPRLAPDKLAPTLRAGSESERGSHTAPRPIHPVHPRCITVREAARLHGYPDWFAFFPVVQHGFRQVGNSVSPLVARAVGYKVAHALGLQSRELRPPSKAIPLGNDFTLSENRLKQERRITHLHEFPKVITHLFDKRFDVASGSIRDPHFTFADIQDAVHQSGAKMPRIRPESFISEFSSTRNAAAILANILGRGYSLRPTSTGGEFVHKDSPGAVGASMSVGFNSKEIIGATAVTPAGHENSSIDLAFRIFEDEDVGAALGKLERDCDLLDFNSDGKQRFRIIGGGRTSKGYFWEAKRSGSIRLDAVEKVARSHDVSTVAVSVSLTQRHLGVVIFDVEDGRAKLRFKKVFVTPERVAS